MGDDDTVSGRCVTCGAHVEGTDRTDFEGAYTDHQVEEHDKPRSAFDESV